MHTDIEESSYILYIRERAVVDIPQRAFGGVLRGGLLRLTEA